MKENFLENLVVMSLPMTEKKKIPYWEGRHDLFTAEACARHVIICTKSDLDKVPIEIIKDSKISHKDFSNFYKDRLVTRIKTGKDAYEFLLAVACDLVSENEGKQKTFSEIRQNWGVFKNRDSSKNIDFLEKILNMVKFDREIIYNQYLGNNILADSVVPAVVGRGLIGVDRKKDEKAIFVSSLKEDSFIKSIKALGVHHLDEIFVVLVNNDTAEKCKKSLESLITENKPPLRAKIKIIDANEVENFCCGSNYLFASINMGKYPQLEANLISLIEKNNLKLCCLQGSSDNLNKTSNQWLNIGAEYKVFIEDILTRKREIWAQNNKNLEFAKEACGAAAKYREKGLYLRSGNLQKGLNIDVIER